MKFLLACNMCTIFNFSPCLTAYSTFWLSLIAFSFLIIMDDIYCLLFWVCVVCIFCIFIICENWERKLGKYLLKDAIYYLYNCLYTEIDVLTGTKLLITDMKFKSLARNVYSNHCLLLNPEQKLLSIILCRFLWKYF